MRGQHYDQKEQSHLLPKIIGAGAVASSPFLGMIGEAPLQDIKNTKRVKLHELARIAKPGDILLGSRPGYGGKFKLFQSPFSGTDLFHSQPVLGRYRGMGTTISAGNLDDIAFGSNRRVVNREIGTIPKEMRDLGYRNVLLMRPDKQLKPAEIARLRSALDARIAGAPYSNVRALKSWLHDIFVPKLKIFENIGQKTTPICVGDTCSTFPAQAYHEAGILKNITKGKRPIDILPADYLRVGSGFSPIAGFNLTKQMRGMPVHLSQVASRGILGAGLGAAALGGMINPLIGLGIGGALLSPTAVRTLIRSLWRRDAHNVIPTARMLIEKDLEEPVAKVLATKILPISAIGGLGTYFGAKKLQDKYTNRKEAGVIEKLATSRWREAVRPGEIVGRSTVLTKLSMGMFPTLKQLFSLGVKPGSGVSLMPFMRAKDREITSRIAQRFAGRTLNRTVPGVRNPLSLGYAKTVLAPVNPMTSGFASTMLASNPYATKLPRRLYPDLSDILKVQAAAAGRYRKFAAVDDKPSLSPHHFRNLLFALGPATGAISGGLEPLVGTFNERIWEGFSHDVPKFPGLFKNYPWKKVLPGAGVGAVKGALGGLLVGAILDKYLQKKLHPRGLLAS